MIRFLTFSLLLAMLWTTPSRSEPLTPSDFTILPKPKIGAFITGNYVFDRAATEAHYDETFAGRTATDVVAWMDANDRNFRFNSPSQLSFLVKERVLVFNFTIGLNLDFKDGVFDKATVWTHGVK